MLKKNVIRAYNIQDTKEPSKTPGKIPSIVKVPDLSENEAEIPDQTQDNKKDPELKVFRNDEQVVTALEVKCSCGETILIKLDY